MFTHGKKISALPINKQQVVVEKPKEENEVAATEVKRSVEPSVTKEKPVVIPKKQIRKKTLLEELLEDEEKEKEEQTE